MATLHLRRAALAALLAVVIQAVPTHPLPAQRADDPEYNFEFLWQTFDRNYALFRAKHIDWRALYNVYRPRVTAATSGDDLFAVMSQMLGHLNDNHVRLTSTAPERHFGAGYLWSQFGKSGMTKLRALLRRRPVLDRRFKAPLVESGNKIFAHGWLDDEIGYMHFNAFGDAEGSSRAIDKIMADFKDARALVVDVRRNGGGDDRIGKLIADRFADRKRLYMTTQDRNGPGHGDFDPKRHFFAEPGGPRQFTRTIILLTNRLSISAAENFALAMRILPHVTVVGDFTSGCFADNFNVRLPIGWNVSLSKNLFLDPHGFCWEGIGVPPDIMVTGDYDLDGADPEKDPALETALSLIRSGHPSPQDESANARPTESLSGLLDKEITGLGLEAAVAAFEERQAALPDGIHYLDFFELESLAKRLFLAGRDEAGAKVLTLAARQFPTAPSIYESLGWEYLKQGQVDRARVSLEKALTQKTAKLSPLAIQFMEYLLDSLVAARLAGGDDGLDRRYRELKNVHPQQLTEEMLNRLGYYLLFEKLAEPAVWLLKLNVRHFPRSANAHDSLGEAYLAAGNRRLAVRHYRRSLVLDPKNENAANILKKLESK